MFGFAKPTNEVWGQFPLMLFFFEKLKKIFASLRAPNTPQKRKRNVQRFPIMRKFWT
jgi:hypothetical protein